MSSAPRVVTPFEGKLLTVLRAVLGQMPLDVALPIIAARHPRPAALSRGAIELIQDSLAKGCVLFLARHGGWRRERFLGDGKPRDGRLWERRAIAELGLHFSRHALELLLWLTAPPPT